jgi:RNA polymerase sigma factor (TIGR02999 family)
MWWEGPPLPASDPKSVTLLLAAVGDGEALAHDRLWSLVYDELRSMARHQLVNEPSAQAMEPTSLVHVAYIRLVGNEHVQWVNRRHFFAAAARAMRQIRVDAARHRKRMKRGGGKRPVPIDQADPGFDDDPVEMLALDEALDKLERIDAVVSEIVHLRFFAGLKVAEVAKALDIAERTVEAKWAFGRAWLHSELKECDTSLGVQMSGGGS